MGKWSILKREKEKTKEIRYILSIDGGGMRGIIPAYLIYKMDGLLKSEFNDIRPFYSHFDLIAGTSTGSLIALALTSPINSNLLKREDGVFPVYDKITTGRFFKKEEEILRGNIVPLSKTEDILSIYLNRGEEIFRLPKTIKNIFGPIFTDKYDGKSLDALLLNAFGDIEIKDCLVPTIAISYETNTSTPYVFSSSNSHGFLSREAARASSAAPTYFPSSNLIDRETGDALNLIDGGVVANNPTLLAYAEAKRLYPDADEYRILSLSTCAPKHSVEVQSSTQGAIGWASPLYKAYTEGQLAMVDRIAPEIDDLKYIRIWAPVIERKIKLDDTSSEAREQLLKAAGDTFLATEDIIRDFLSDISTEPTHRSVKLKEDIEKDENKPILISSQE